MFKDILKKYRRNRTRFYSVSNKNKMTYGNIKLSEDSAGKIK